MASTRLALVVGQLGIGGTEKQACLLARGLPRYGFEPLVVALAGGHYETFLREENVRTVVLNPRRRFDVGRLLRTTQAIREFKPAIVHGFDYAGSVYGKLAALAAGTPIMVGGLRCEYTPPARVVWGERVLRRWTTAVISNSLAGKRRWMDLVGSCEEKIAVIPNGIDMSELEALPQGFQPIRRLLKLADGTPLVGCVSSIYHLKNPLMFARGAARVHAANRAARFVWIGDGPMRADLASAIGSLGLTEVCHLIGARADARWLVKDLTVGVLTSISEGLPNSIMEYLAWGVPAVVTDAGGCPEIVEHGRSGYVVPNDDDDAMAARILDLLSNPKRAIQMGAYGRARMVNEYSVDRMIERTTTVYRALMAGQRAALADGPAASAVDDLIEAGR